MSIGKVLALVAVVIFALAALGAWPDSLSDDVEPIALGLAFLAARVRSPRKNIFIGDGLGPGLMQFIRINTGTQFGWVG
jgi:hypothetical protein